MMKGCRRRASMSKFAVRRSFFALLLVLLSGFSLNVAAQAPKPLRAGEVLALEVGGAMQANVVHHVAARGLNFQPDEDFLSLLKKAGADATVLTAVKNAKVSADAVKPEKELLGQLTS